MRHLRPFFRGVYYDYSKLGSQVMATVKEVQAKLNTHEAVCAERWKETIERIKRLELIMITSAGAVIILMAGMLWKI
jgi:hypothetical protein|tara:strand:+ start:2416 stop:2646 length:231 start_codon:yes stop_codon:yes gene_type:complete